MKTYIHGSRGLPPKYGQTVDVKPLTANPKKPQFAVYGKLANPQS